MTCLLKRALPLIFGLAVGFSLVMLFKTVSSFTPLQSVFSADLSQIDVALIPPSHPTRNEYEALNWHSSIGLCHAHAKAIDVIETVTDRRATTKAKILYMPEPSNWEKQHPCTRCLVMLRATLDASGKVSNIVPMYIDSHAEAVDASVECKKDVLASVEQIRFEPAMKNGKPVSQLVTFIYDKWGRGVEVR